MSEEHSSFASKGARRLGSRLGSPHQATIDALGAPTAILAASGVVVAANRVWLEACRKGGDGAICPPGENYLHWSRTQTDGSCDELFLHGVRRLLMGEQKSFEWQQNAHADRPAGRHVRLRRIEGEQPARFLVSHEFRSADGADELESRILTAQIEERERLAAELHDSVGQKLVCLGLSVGRLRQIARPGSEVAGIVADMAAVVQQAHAEIRTLSFLLQPPWLEERGAFETAVRDLVCGFGRRAGLHATAAASEVSNLCRGRQLALFRVLQEALVNVYRHAQADAVEVELAARGRHVILKVRDNGRGMPGCEGAPPNPGVGILSMRARLQKWGGGLQIVGSQDGTTVTAKLPIA